MNHSAEFIFETPDAEKIYEVLLPETGSDPGEKSFVVLEKEGARLILKIQAEDVSAMRASVNMWIRLISVSSEIFAM